MRPTSDPEAFVAALPKNKDGDILVLGLDLGTKCGCAFTYVNPAKPVVEENLEMHLSLWDLSAGAFDSGAIRFVRLRRFLNLMQPSLIGYEQPKFTPSGSVTRFNAGAIMARAAKSMEFFGALMSVVASWAEENGVPCQGFPIGTIKRHATGKGNANKIQMIEACNKVFDTDFELTEDYKTTGVDNVADAAFICSLTATTYANGVSE